MAKQSREKIIGVFPTTFVFGMLLLLRFFIYIYRVSIKSVCTTHGLYGHPVFMSMFVNSFCKIQYNIKQIVDLSDEQLLLNLVTVVLLVFLKQTFCFTVTYIKPE